MEWTVEGSVYFACADGFGAAKSCASFAQRLVAAGETHRSAAHRLGVSAALIGFWRSGVARPEHHYRVALERIVGIQVDDWMTDDEYQVAYGRPRLRVVGSG